MPIAPWAKLAMMVQSVTLLAILGLVIARAVSVFTIADRPQRMAQSQFIRSG